MGGSMQNYRGRNRYTRELYVSEVKAILIALGVVIALLLTGCSGPRHGIEENGYRRFKAVATYADGTEIVDKDTGFGYFVFSGGGGIVPLLNEDGNPYRENGWRDFGA